MSYFMYWIVLATISFERHRKMIVLFMWSFCCRSYDISDICLLSVSSLFIGIFFSLHIYTYIHCPFWSLHFHFSLSLYDFAKVAIFKQPSFISIFFLYLLSSNTSAHFNSICVSVVALISNFNAFEYTHTHFTARDIANLITYFKLVSSFMVLWCLYLIAKCCKHRTIATAY